MKRRKFPFAQLSKKKIYQFVASSHYFGSHFFLLLSFHIISKAILHEYTFHFTIAFVFAICVERIWKFPGLKNFEWNENDQWQVYQRSHYKYRLSINESTQHNNPRDRLSFCAKYKIRLLINKRPVYPKKSVVFSFKPHPIYISMISWLLSGFLGFNETKRQR